MFGKVDHLPRSSPPARFSCASCRAYPCHQDAGLPVVLQGSCCWFWGTCGPQKRLRIGSTSCSLAHQRGHPLLTRKLQCLVCEMTIHPSMLGGNTLSSCPPWGHDLTNNPSCMRRCVCSCSQMMVRNVLEGSFRIRKQSNLRSKAMLPVHQWHGCGMPLKSSPSGLRLICAQVSPCALQCCCPQVGQPLGYMASNASTRNQDRPSHHHCLTAGGTPGPPYDEPQWGPCCNSGETIEAGQGLSAQPRAKHAQATMHACEKRALV